jgi:hypothetical protein
MEPQRRSEQKPRAEPITTGLSEDVPIPAGPRMTQLRSATDHPGTPRTRGSSQDRRGSAVLDLLRPGSFVRLQDHPHDLPPFQLIRCRGGRCWVRQQAWGGLVQWEVAHRRLTPVL